MVCVGAGFWVAFVLAPLRVEVVSGFHNPNLTHNRYGC